ncbi:MAG TPA: response regulator transcription factor [Candidatus Acidoferrum sp.]|nr:response regulator transcription factor [Candidatus Acidoferrum sp.]
MRILAVEDDPILADFVVRHLQAEKFDVVSAVSAAEAERQVETGAYDLVIFDLAVPINGNLDLLARIRATRPDILLLALSASVAVQDCIRCLESGADDYMTKPFSAAELSARVRALFRRANGPAKLVLKVEDLELDRIKRTVRRGGYTIELTHKEFVLLDFLMQHALQPVARKAIVEQAWKLSPGSMTNVVDVYINYLRKKVDSGFDRPLIHTIRGVGYQIGGA